jgi:hypothetical protein
MDKIVLTVKQESALYEYAEWLADHPVPCDDCIAKQDSVICEGCDQQLNWIEDRARVKSAFRTILGEELSTSSTIQKLIHLYVERIRLDKQLKEIKDRIYNNSEEILSFKKSGYVTVEIGNE